ncbi:MAG: hypothetical protein IKS15_01875 [Opitutales bacterium]|nr:hypothetical protein [Opitutales bacterium]
MKNCKKLLIGALCMAQVFAFAGARIVRKLDGEGWSLWLDRDAKYQNDKLHINKVDAQKIKDGRADWLEKVDVKNIEVAAPTCGWENLFAKPVDWSGAEKAWRDKCLSLKVSVPGTVEEYFFDAISGKNMGKGASGDYRGVSWWGRKFEVPAQMKGKRIKLRFGEGIRHRAEVFVNRKLAGYELVLQSPFEIDITDFVKFGSENELAVRITDANGNFSWGDYTFTKWGNYQFPLSHGFGGILGGVELFSTDAVCVADIFVKNKPALRDIDTLVEIANDSAAAKTVFVEAKIIENWAGGKAVETPKTVFEAKVGKFEIPANSAKVVEFNSVVENAKLWEIGNANLYDMQITLKDESGKVLDEYSDRFGFRFFEAKGIGDDAKFYLNGKRVFLLSAISWSFWPSNGIVPSKELARRHVESAIKLGMNMINFHRCRGNNAVLSFADEMGVLYYEEPGGFSSYRVKGQNMDGVDTSIAHEICRQKLLRMVKDHRNHASLVIYNMVNEPGWPPDDLSKEAMACAHLLDPTRFICYGSGFMGVKNPEPTKLHMLPYDQKQYTVGYCDIHNACNSPGVYVDSNYNSPAGFLRSERDAAEIFVWGEEGALASPPQLELIQAEKKGKPNGWDGQEYDTWYNGYKNYIESKGLKKNFPSITGLITSMGDIMYYEHGRILENVRIADGAEIYVLNGYEDMKDDNLSGAVDCYRNLKGSAELVARHMKPLAVAVKAREKLGHVGDVNAFDLFVLNEYVLPAGEYKISASVRAPKGKVKKLYEGTAKVSGGEKFSDLAAENIKVNLDSGAGYYIITAELFGKDGKVVACGKDEMFAVDYKSAKIKSKGAVIGGGSEYARFASDILKADLKPYAENMGRLDYILLAPTDQGKNFKPISPFNFRAKDGKSIGLSLDYFRGKNFGMVLDRRISTAPIDFNLKSKLIPGYDILGTVDFSLRWEGFVISDYSGEVEFEFACDDGARVWFGGEPVVNKWTNGPKSVFTFKRKMEAGKKYPIKIEAYQDGGDWLSSLKWKLPVPETKVDLNKILKRVSEDGTKLILIEGAEDWLKELRKLGAFPEYEVFHPHKTWVGHNMFVKDHPFFEGLPVNCGMNWEYQNLVVYDGPKHFGLLMQGEEPLVGLVGVPLRGIATSVGIVDCGKGKIVFSSLDIAPNLALDTKPSATPKKIFSNILKWAGKK